MTSSAHTRSTPTTRDLREVAGLSLAATGGKVDREAGVIRGVKYLGPESSNICADGLRNVYPLEFRRSSREAYRDAPIFVDHPSDETPPGAPRSLRDRIGRLEPTTEDEHGSYGDLHLNRGHALYEQVMWAAENDPAQVHCSHNAQATGRRDGDRWVAESMTRVRSVDLVAAGGTVRSLYESLRQEPAMTTPATPAVPSFGSTATVTTTAPQPREVREMQVDAAPVVDILMDDGMDDAAKVKALLGMLVKAGMGGEKKEEGDEETPMMEALRDDFRRTLEAMRETPSQFSEVRRALTQGPGALAELTDLRRKVAEMELREAQRAREDALDRVLREAALPEGLVTDGVRASLLKLHPQEAQALVRQIQERALVETPESGHGATPQDDYKRAMDNIRARSRPV